MFSLTKGDVIRITGADGAPRLFVVRAISNQGGGRLRIGLHTDARPADDRERSGTEPMIGSLARFACEKLTVTPIGIVRRSRA